MTLRNQFKKANLLFAFFWLQVGCAVPQKSSSLENKLLDQNFTAETFAVPSLKAGRMSKGELSDGALRNQTTESQKINVLSDNDSSYLVGSCKDDIYVSWLVEQYKISHPFKGKEQKDSASWEKEALTFALTKLSDGPAIEVKNTLPLVENAEVNKWIRQFKTADRSTLLQWLARGESLDHIIIPELERQGVPKEFFYLAMIESGFNSHARSPMAAAGAWQIMPATGRLYDLKINRFIDERKDPVKSSVAAAKLLRDLYQKFGDWYLTMAAYNAGPTLVQKAISKGETRDFWTLAQKSLLPRETAQYVPRWIAAYTLGSQPEKYGFQINEKNEFVMPSSYVELTKTYYLSDLAKSVNIKVETLKKWNPEILTGVTPPISEGKTYKLRLDDQLKNLLESKLTSIPSLNIRETFTYKISRGDTLRSIAKRHGVSLAEIIKLNPEIKTTNLRIGKSINLPTS